MNTHPLRVVASVCVFNGMQLLSLPAKNVMTRTNSKHEGDWGSPGYSRSNLQSGTGIRRKRTPYHISFCSFVNLFNNLLSEEFVCACVRIGRSTRKFGETHGIQVRCTSGTFTALIRFQSADAKLQQRCKVRPENPHQLIRQKYSYN
jgi:hypothetical protein